MLQIFSCHCLRDALREGEDNANVVSDFVGGKSSDLITEALISEADMPHLFPSGPRAHSTRTYGLAKATPLHGERKMRGRILVLQRQSQTPDGKPLGEEVIEATVSIYTNGFSITSAARSGASKIPEAVPEAEEQCFTWSPFSAVERHNNQAMSVKFAQRGLSVFKLTILRRRGIERSFCFATMGPDSSKERNRWMEAMASSIGAVTASLFPPHGITAKPVPGVHSTSTRILAGYLLHMMQDDVVSVIYCELHTYLCGESRLSVYKGEWCDWEMMSIRFTQDAVVTSRKGVRCTVFSVDRSTFAARSPEERELWLRALGNVKVKLMFDAPDPTGEDLEVIRKSVQDQIVSMEDRHFHKQSDAMDEARKTRPLLPELPRGPLPVAPGGDEDPAAAVNDDRVEAPEPSDGNSGPSFGGRCFGVHKLAARAATDPADARAQQQAQDVRAAAGAVLAVVSAAAPASAGDSQLPPAVHVQSVAGTGSLPAPPAELQQPPGESPLDVSTLGCFTRHPECCGYDKDRHNRQRGFSAGMMEPVGSVGAADESLSEAVVISKGHTKSEIPSDDPVAAVAAAAAAVAAATAWGNGQVDAAHRMSPPKPIAAVGAEIGDGGGIARNAGERVERAGSGLSKPGRATHVEARRPGGPGHDQGAAMDSWV